MIMERLFYCHATEELYTLDDVEQFRQMSIAAGDTFSAGDLESYINCCLTENNGERVPHMGQSLTAGGSKTWTETSCTFAVIV